MAGDSILSIAYGIRVQETDNPHLGASQASFKALAEAGVPGAFWVDTFPLLKYVPAWFPGASFQRRKLARAVLELPYAEAKKRFVGTLLISKEMAETN
jgi:hypothetical protein